jgi:hypothetical protein
MPQIFDLNRRAELNLARRQLPDRISYARSHGPARLRIYKYEPETVALQIRAGDHFAHAVLDAAEIDQLIEMLQTEKAKLYVREEV